MRVMELEVIIVIWGLLQIMCRKRYLKHHERAEATLND